MLPPPLMTVELVEKANIVVSEQVTGSLSVLMIDAVVVNTFHGCTEDICYLVDERYESTY